MMKKYVLTLCAATALALNPSLKAEEDYKQGGSINGIENLNVVATFLATSNAPAGATGILRFQSQLRANSSKTKMRVRTRSLSAGTYNLSVTLKSDGSTVSVGQITLETNQLNSILVSDSNVELPKEISPMNIAQVTLSDESAAAILVADLLTAPAKSVVVFNSCVRVSSTNSAVRGSAVLRTFAHNGNQNGHFLMVVHHLPPSTTLHLVVNGTDVGSVTTNRRGSVLIRQLEGQDLTHVYSVALQDDLATTLVEASF